MAILIAAAQDFDHFKGPALSASVHVDDLKEFIARLRNAAAQNGWYLAKTESQANLILVTPTQHAKALEGLEANPVKFQ